MVQVEFPYNDRVVDLRQIRKSVRNRVSIELIEHLRVNASLQLITDSSPIEIKRRIQGQYGNMFQWKCLQAGPEVWHAHVRRIVQSAVA